MSKCRSCGTIKYQSKDICPSADCATHSKLVYLVGYRRADRHNRQPISATTKHGFHEPAVKTR